MKRRPCGGARITRWREITSLKLTLSAVAVPAGTTGVALARDNVQISGSSTVLPYATIVAEAFGENFEFPTPVVEGGGSGAGRKKMCEGVGENTIDIANSSSRISKSDIELCAANGVTGIMEVRIGYDGIVFASKVDGHDSRVRFLLPAEVPAMSAARLSDIWRLRTPRQSLLIWALLLVAIMGPGLLAGVVAIGLRSIGFIGKLLYEAIEEVDVNQVEAVTATGASRAQVLDYAIVPQVLPAFWGITVFRWDIDIRESAILGLVGAGGLGLKLQSSLNVLAWPQVTMILIVILATVVLSEWVSARVRGAII